MATWGSSRGNQLGYKIFIAIIRAGGIYPAYALLRLVSIYYFFFPGKAAQSLLYYFQRRLGYSALKARLSIYENFNYLGRTIIDKIVLMSGLANPFNIRHDGVHFLEQMVLEGKGGLLVSAHVGNWEGAGHLLRRLQTKINIVMDDGEHEKIKQYLETVRERSFHVIVIRDDLSHIYEIKEAVERNEFVCIHADRYVEGTKTITGQLLGADARFPIGPFVLATTFDIPVSFVYAMKEGPKHYHFFASAGKVYPHGKAGIPLMLEDYLRKTETMIRAYPLQWHNYFPYWEEEKNADR